MARSGRCRCSTWVQLVIHSSGACQTPMLPPQRRSPPKTIIPLHSASSPRADGLGVVLRSGAKVVSRVWMPWSRPALDLDAGLTLHPAGRSFLGGRLEQLRKETGDDDVHREDRRRPRRQAAMATVQGARQGASHELPHDGQGAGAVPDVLRGDHEGGRPDRRPDVDARRSRRPVRAGRGGPNPDPRGRRRRSGGLRRDLLRELLGRSVDQQGAGPVGQRHRARDPQRDRARDQQRAGPTGQGHRARRSTRGGDPLMTTQSTAGPALRVQGLEKSYKKLEVLRGVDFEVARGSILALLGPNGAGKTTVVRTLSTLLKADTGTVGVNGYDVATQAADVRESFSLTGQFAAVDEILSGRENLVLVAKLRHLKNPGAIADDLLDRFSLTDAATRRAATYSGGMRRRLDIAMSLIGNP